jgi:hypothetical protein
MEMPTNRKARLFRTWAWLLNDESALPDVMARQHRDHDDSDGVFSVR